MIEQVIFDFLNQKLNGKVFMETPMDKPSKFYLFEKVGSRKSNHLVSSTIAFQSISSISLLDAAEMNQTLIKYVESLIEESEIISVSLNSDYNFTDVTTKEYRYQAVFDIIHY